MPTENEKATEINREDFEKAVFSNIDRVLQEPNGLDKVKEEPNGLDKVKEEILNKIEERFLTVDWEMDDSYLEAFSSEADEAKEFFQDKSSLALISMMTSIIKYLSKAKHLAPPTAAQALRQAATAFKQINITPIPEEERIEKTKEVYVQFKELKKEIERAKGRKEGISEEQKELIISEIRPIKQDLERLEDTLHNLAKKINEQFGQIQQYLGEIKVLIEEQTSLIKTQKAKEEAKEEIQKYKEPLPTVCVASINNNVVAIPSNNVANIYRISAKKAKRLCQAKEIKLSELKSPFRSLKRGLRGTLKSMSEKELKKMTLSPFKTPFTPSVPSSYRGVMLLEQKDRYGLLFIDKPIKFKEIQPTSSHKGSVEIGKEEDILLLDVNTLFS